MRNKLGWLAVAAGLLVGGTVQAGTLDTKLNEEMPKIVKYLKDKGYKNVGVLPFQAQRGMGKPGFSTGPINTAMVDRLEKMLVIHAGTEKGPQFGVTHEVGHGAQHARVGHWATNEAERKKLFEVNYPLAWGESKVKVDAFLTGKVVNPGDRKKTMVTIEAISKSSPTRVKVTEFTVDTDHALVRELGYNFAFTKQQRSQLVKARGDEQVLDDLTLQQARNNEKPQQQPKPGEKPQPTKQQGQASPKNTAGIEFSVLVGGEDRSISEGGSGEARFEMLCPPKGKPILMKLKNNDKEKTLAVVLKVAGKNTIDLQTEDADKCRKWVLKPGEEFKIEGYYSGDKAESLDRFAVFDGEEAKKAIEELGDKAQFIQIDVFSDETTIQENDKRVTPRSLKPAVAREARKHYSTYRDMLKKAYGLSLVRGREGEMVLGPSAEGRKAVKESEVVDFKSNPAPVGSLTIKVTPTPTQQKPPQPIPQPNP